MNHFYLKYQRTVMVAFLFLAAISSVFAQQAIELNSKSLTVPRYANLAAINSAITVPLKGMVVFNETTNNLWVYNGTNWIESQNQWSGITDIYRTTGRVGIGTSTPAAPLDVKTTSSYVAQFNGSSPMYLGLFENDVYRGYWGSFSGSAEDVDFGTGAGNTLGKLHLTIQANPRLTIGSTGNVGIGTTSPNHKLHVNGGDLFVQSSSGLIRLGYAGGNEWQMATTGAGADLRWYITPDGGTTITPRHYFSQNGNVGIGGFSGPGVPISRLDVIGSGTTSSSNNFTLRNSVGDTLLRMRDDGRMGIGYNGASYGRTINLGGTGINFYTTNEAAFGGAIYPSDTSMILWSNSGVRNYLIFQPSWGNTGIGTYSPKAKLHLNGTMLIGATNNRIAAGSQLSVNGRITATDVVTLPYASWPDYVFEDNYKLMPLENLERKIKAQKHLPRIPSAAEIKQNGISSSIMIPGLLEKVEELTLYIIELNKTNKDLLERIQKLEKVEK